MGPCACAGDSACGAGRAGDEGGSGCTGAVEGAGVEGAGLVQPVPDAVPNAETDAAMVTAMNARLPVDIPPTNIS